MPCWLAARDGCVSAGAPSDASTPGAAAPILLKDGTSSRLRFRKDPAEPTCIQAEWSGVASRIDPRTSITHSSPRTCKP